MLAPLGQSLINGFGWKAAMVAFAAIAASMAVLSLPIREYANYSIRSAGETGGVTFTYATQWSFSPVEMLTFVVPGALGFGGRTYWGTMPFTDLTVTGYNAGGRNHRPRLGSSARENNTYGPGQYFHIQPQTPVFDVSRIERQTPRKPGLDRELVVVSGGNLCSRIGGVQIRRT